MLRELFARHSGPLYEKDLLCNSLHPHSTGPEICHPPSARTLTQVPFLWAGLSHCSDDPVGPISLPQLLPASSLAGSAVEHGSALNPLSYSRHKSQLCCPCVISETHFLLLGLFQQLTSSRFIPATHLVCAAQLWFNHNGLYARNQKVCFKTTTHILIQRATMLESQNLHQNGP